MRYFFFTIFICFYTLYAQELELEKNIVEVGGATQLSLKFPVKYQAIPYQNNSDKYTFGKIATIDTIDQTIVQNFSVIVLDTGKIAIGPFLFLDRQDTIKSNVVYISPKEMDLDTSLAIKDIENYEGTNLGLGDYLLKAWNWAKKHWYFAFIPPVLLGLLLFFLLKKKRANPSTPEKVKTLSELTLERIASLENSSFLKEEQYNLYYFELTYIIRWYLQEKFHTPLLNKTNEEMGYELDRLPIADEIKAPFKAIFHHSVLIKFAKQSVDHHLAQSDLKKLKDYLITLEKENNTDESH